MGQTPAEAPSLLPDGGLRSAVSTDQGRGAEPTSFGRRVRVDAKPRYLLSRDHDRLQVAITVAATRHRNPGKSNPRPVRSADGIPGGALMGVMGSVIGRSVTLEVRWIQPGRLPVAMIERLGPFSEGIEEREDFYLSDPRLPDLSIKIRGGVYLDTKAFRNSPGQLVLPSGASGRLELSDKWSFPLDGVQRPPRRSNAWKQVEKVRRRRSFVVADNRLVERALARAATPGCSVELTEVTVDRAAWWTLSASRPSAHWTLSSRNSRPPPCP